MNRDSGAWNWCGVFEQSQTLVHRCIFSEQPIDTDFTDFANYVVFYVFNGFRKPLGAFALFW